MGYQRIQLPDTGKLARKAASILADAQATRAAHRRHERFDRDDALTGAILQINDIQKQLRSVISAAAFRYVEHEEELRSLSEGLQRERRKLRKMLGRSRR